MRGLFKYFYCLVVMACYATLTCSSIAVTFNGIEPGVTDKGSVDRVLGKGKDGSKTSGMQWYVYQHPQYDSIHVQYDKNIIRILHLRFKDLIPIRLVLDTLQVKGDSEWTETRDDGTLADYYRNQGVIVVYKMVGRHKLACWVNLVESRYVKIINAWVELDKVHPDHFGSGILVHLDFQAVGMMNEAVAIDGLCSINDVLNGNPGVPARSASYADKDGNAFVRQVFTPRRRVVNYRDFMIFMPYDQLFLPAGKNDLLISVKMSVGQKEMASVDKPFCLNLKTPWNRARILKTDVEHNVVDDDLKGMRVHVHFKIGDQKGKKCVASLFVYDKAGLFPIKGYGWANSDGNVMSRVSFKPKHPIAEYKDLELFLPYSEIRKPAPGKVDLIGRIIIYDDKDHGLVDSRFTFRLD